MALAVHHKHILYARQSEKTCAFSKKCVRPMPMVQTRHTHIHVDNRTDIFQIHTADTPEGINLAENSAFTLTHSERTGKTEALSWVQLCGCEDRQI